MKKKYQVFVSSTFTDLVEERKKVMESLLQMNCFPVGMEYFNASDESQWEVIQKLINECDYYILILAGRYGSIEESSKKSYTQKEYEYAVQQKIPVISFLYKNPEEIVSKKVETVPEKRTKLKEFREEVEHRLCRYWSSADELASQTVLSLNYMISTNERTGWVRADTVSSEEANKEIIRLRNENDILKKRLENYSSYKPNDIEDLKQGTDLFEIRCSRSNNPFDPDSKKVTEYIKLSWEQIFNKIAPSLIEPILKNNFYEVVNKALLTDDLITTSIDKVSADTILIQLTALKLVTIDLLKYDGLYTYVTLTDYGRKEMVRLRALKK